MVLIYEPGRTGGNVTISYNVNRSGMDSATRDECRQYSSYYLEEARHQEQLVKEQHTILLQTGGRLPAFIAYNGDEPKTVLGINESESEFNQNGKGLGAIFSMLGRLLFPAVKAVGKKALKALGGHALTTTSNIIGDVIGGENIAEAGKRRLKETGNNIMNQVQNQVQKTAEKFMTGSGYYGSISLPGNKRQKLDAVYDCHSRDNKKARAQNILFSIKPPPLAIGSHCAPKRKQLKKPLKRLDTAKKKKVQKQAARKKKQKKQQRQKQVKLKKQEKQVKKKQKKPVKKKKQSKLKEKKQQLKQKQQQQRKKNQQKKNKKNQKKQRQPRKQSQGDKKPRSDQTGQGYSLWL
jgi:hypothetical protein